MSTNPKLSNTMPMEITVNGETRSLPDGQTVLHLLALLGLDPDRVAVELDLQILKRARWAET